MKDSEIIKAYEEEISKPQNHYIGTVGILWNVLDLIKRQQAEIESLKNANGLFEYLNYAAHHYVINGKTWTQEFATIEARNKAIHDKVVLLSDIQTAKSEAVREFARNLKKEVDFINTTRELKQTINRLVEEMGCNDG